MALDLLPSSSSSFPASTQARRSKRPRLRWDDPGPSSFLSDNPSRLQLHLASPIFLSNPDASTSNSLISGVLSTLPVLVDPESTDLQAVVSAQPMQLYTDDKDGHLNFEVGGNLTPRYKILGKMGEGTFGRVLECWDRDGQELVAIKVIRSAQKYREDAMIEIDVLSTLDKNDKMEHRGCVQFKRWFDFQNHICIVFEKLGSSLYDFLKENDYRPFSIDLIRDFGRQLLASVAYMHSLSLIHTDLKPENVLLVSSEYRQVNYKNGVKNCSTRSERIPKSSRIKLIDFGSTTFGSEHNYSVVSTRHYRAPEVILGSGWSYPCDIWSIGCILVELCSGEVLFQTHENLEHLAMMERVLGPVPRHMIRRASKGRSEKYFRHGRRLNWPEGAPSRESTQIVRRMSDLRDIVVDNADRCGRLFLDLLQQLLRYDPADRPTARQALEHPFFRC